MRPSGRQPDQMRSVTLERNVATKAEGSCLVSFGATRVLVTASVETGVPSWRRGQGLGTAGTATVAAVIVGSGRTASLYVNGFNEVARAAYARVGFAEVGTFATILLD